jgi:hypothetical protein
MGKKSKHRPGPRESSASANASKQYHQDIAGPGVKFIAYPQPGDGIGKGRSYDRNEITPWKKFCANFYAGAVVYQEIDVDLQEEYSLVSTPESECSNCRMAWYCDENCQKQHWKWHKQTCKASSGTKEERKATKKRARQWERENSEMLDKEWDKLEYQINMIQEQREFLEACEAEGPAPRFVRECVDSSDEE